MKTNKNEKIIKKYCLLSNGDIKPCYYSNGELRNLTKEDGQWFMVYDEYAHNMIITCCRRIVAFSDSIQELEKIKK